jgi:hypothetical protein
MSYRAINQYIVARMPIVGPFSVHFVLLQAYRDALNFSSLGQPQGRISF